MSTVVTQETNPTMAPPEGGDPNASAEDTQNFEDMTSEELREYFGEDFLPDPDPDLDPDPDPITEPTEFNKQRLRPKSDKDQQVIDLYKSDGFTGTFQDAVNTIYGNKSQPTAENPGGANPGAAPEQSGSETAIEATTADIATLEQQMNEAAEAGETQKALTLQRQLTQKEFDLRDLRAQQQADARQAEEAEMQEYQNQAAVSWQTAVKSTPDLADQTSETRAAFDQFRTEKEADPAFAPIFSSPKWPEILVQQFLASRGARPAAPAPRAPAAPKAARNKTRVLTSGAPTPQGGARPSQITPTAIMNNLDKLSTEALRGLLSN